jgi:predicted nucleic acid-binding protein
VIVVDASALVEVLLGGSASGPITKRLFGRGETVHAPHLIDLEASQAIRRYLSSGVADLDRSQGAVRELVGFPLVRHRHDAFLYRIWELRHNVTAYDAAYLALAEALGAPLVTRDAKLAGAAGHRARVELL